MIEVFEISPDIQGAYPFHNPNRKPDIVPNKPHPINGGKETVNVNAHMMKIAKFDVSHCLAMGTSQSMIFLLTIRNPIPSANNTDSAKTVRMRWGMFIDSQISCTRIANFWARARIVSRHVRRDDDE